MGASSSKAEENKSTVPPVSAATTQAADVNEPVASVSRPKNKTTFETPIQVTKDDGKVGGSRLEIGSKSDIGVRKSLLLNRRNLKGSGVRESLLLNRRSLNRSATGNPSANHQTTVIKLTRKKQSAFVCVSIDFGTTYSGYAYSFKSSPNAIIGRGRGKQIKTPTVVLLDPQKEMVAFGEEAKTKYQELVKLKIHGNWFLFERFKMALFTRDGPLDKDMVIEDILGKKMEAKEIFSHAIRFIKTEIMNTLTDKKQMSDMGDFGISSETDVHWVLTVPAIWNDLSKKFMRDAATKAGIPDELLTLALEPEAASLYCKEQLGVSHLPAGQRYMVLDLGGGTADITAHEVNPNGTLSEIYQPTGGNFGGTNVDNKFINTLVQIFGAPLFQKFKQHFMDEYLEFMQNFEIKKRNFDSTKRITIRFPVQLREMYEEEVDETVESSLGQKPFAKQLEFKNDKLIISVDMVKSFFDEPLERIIKIVEDVVENVKPVNHILLVGGFSESPYLQSVLRNKFGKMVIIPQEPSLAVLHGAVMYGHKPLAIAARVCKYTYGIARLMKFKPHHPQKKKIQIDGMDYCDDIFNIHIEIGTRISEADAENVTAHEYFPSSTDMKQAVLEIYASPKKNPKFVDEDGCQFVGLIKVDIDPEDDIFSKLLVKLMFGGTELRIQVTDVKHNTVTNACVDFLG